MRFNKIMVTGGAGFIASHFANMLHEQEQDLVVVDKLTYASNVGNLHPNIPFEKRDICDVTAKQFPDVDCIVNFAAETHVDNSLVDESPFHRTNYLGVANLLKVARELNVKRFVQVSTDEVYGPSKHGECYTEEARFNPSSPYAASKAAAEMLVNAYHTSYGLNTVITRGSNTYGMNQYPEKLIPLTIKNALADIPIPVYGDGNARRMYIYVKDHASAIEYCMKYGISGEAYNIAGTVVFAEIIVINKILYFLQKPNSLIEFVEDRKGHDCRYNIWGKKLQNLGWTHRYTNFDILLRQIIIEHKKQWGY